MVRLNLSALIVGFLVLLPFPASAQVGGSCPAKSEDGGFIVQESWKSKFPFDLVYPISDPDTDVDDVGKCPTFEFWGVQREMCTIPQIAAIVKTVFVVKFGLDFIKEG